MAIWRNTTYYEAMGSPEESYKIDESGVRRRCFIPDSANIRRQAAVDFLGFARRITAGSGPTAVNYVSRIIPHPYPTPASPITIPGGIGVELNQGMWCTSIERTQPLGITAQELMGTIEGGFDTIGQARRFAEMRLHYQCFNFPNVFADGEVLAVPSSGLVGTDNPLSTGAGGPYPDEGSALARGWWNFSRYIKRTLKGGSRRLKVGSGRFKYITDAVSTPEPFEFNEPLLDVIYTQYWVPLGAYPQIAIVNGLGCVNGTMFDGWPPGMLMFLQTATEEHIDALGQFVLNITHHFRGVARIRRGAPGVTMQTGQSLGWNAYPRVYSGGAYDFEIVSSDGGPDLNRRPFQSYDFSRLFRPDQNYVNTFVGP